MTICHNNVTYRSLKLDDFEEKNLIRFYSLMNVLSQYSAKRVYGCVL